MATVSVYVPNSVKEEMGRFEEVNWSAVAKNAIQRKLDLLKKLDTIADKSTLTEKDAIELGRLVRRSTDQFS